MNIEAIAPLATESIGSIAAPTSTAGDTAAKGVDFMQWMNTQVGDVNSQIQSAQSGLTQLATGETGNLHHVMLELEKAKLAFQLTVQVRNKILEGYQDIMRMQI
jgi:flagellar hook-basal body complex protein FliE